MCGCPSDVIKSAYPVWYCQKIILLQVCHMQTTVVRHMTWVPGQTWCHWIYTSGPKRREFQHWQQMEPALINNYLDAHTGCRPHWVVLVSPRVTCMHTSIWGDSCRLLTMLQSMAYSMMYILCSPPHQYGSQATHNSADDETWCSLYSERGLMDQVMNQDEYVSSMWCSFGMWLYQTYFSTLVLDPCTMSNINITISIPCR